MNNYKKIKSENKDEHILVMEAYLGRPLEEGEIVHHIDNDKKHNEIENLELCLLSIHSAYHGKQGDHFDIGKWNHEQAKLRPMEHGSRYGYRQRNCRCDECRKWNRQDVAKRRRKHA